MSHSGGKFAIVYTLHGACIQTPVSILYDPKRPRSVGACDVCRVWRCGVLNEGMDKINIVENINSLLLNCKIQYLLWILKSSSAERWRAVSGECIAVGIFCSTGWT